METAGAHSSLFLGGECRQTEQDVVGLWAAEAVRLGVLEVWGEKGWAGHTSQRLGSWPLQGGPLTRP